MSKSRNKRRKSKTKRRRNHKKRTKKKALRTSRRKSRRKSRRRTKRKAKRKRGGWPFSTDPKKIRIPNEMFNRYNRHYPPSEPGMHLKKSTKAVDINIMKDKFPNAFIPEDEDWFKKNWVSTGGSVDFQGSGETWTTRDSATEYYRPDQPIAKAIIKERWKKKKESYTKPDADRNIKKHVKNLETKKGPRILYRPRKRHTFDNPNSEGNRFITDEDLG